MDKEQNITEVKDDSWKTKPFSYGLMCSVLSIWNDRPMYDPYYDQEDSVEDFGSGECENVNN